MHDITSGGSRKIFGEEGLHGPSSFGRQQRLSEITIEPINFFFFGGGETVPSGPTEPLLDITY